MKSMTVASFLKTPFLRRGLVTGMMMLVALAIMTVFSAIRADQAISAPMPDDQAGMSTTPTPSTRVVPGGAWSNWAYRQYLPHILVPHPATATPTPTPTFTPTSTLTPAPTGDLVWSRVVEVVVAHSTPPAPIAGALVEARDITYDSCTTGPDGWCTVRVWAHDTHYVSIKVSATGFQTRQIGVPALPSWGEITIPLEPESRQSVKAGLQVGKFASGR